MQNSRKGRQYGSFTSRFYYKIGPTPFIAVLDLTVVVKTVKGGQKRHVFTTILYLYHRKKASVHRRSWHGPPPFSNFLFTNLFSIKFLYFFIISSLFPYFILFVSISGADPGFVVRGCGAWVGEGSGDRLRFPAGPRQSTGRDPRRAKPPGNSGGLRNYRHLFERQFWTNHTIFIRPKKLDFES
jgi:hypothetical protein